MERSLQQVAPKVLPLHFPYTPNGKNSEYPARKARKTQIGGGRSMESTDFGARAFIPQREPPQPEPKGSRAPPEVEPKLPNTCDLQCTAIVGASKQPERMREGMRPRANL